MRKILLTMLYLACFGAMAQDHKANLDEAAAAVVRERLTGQNQAIMLHTDKAHYKLGSLMYFRVYVYNAITHVPIVTARVHVDLYDPADSLVASLLLNSASYELDGSIKTSAKWNPGPYVMKVYTEEMVMSPAISKPFEHSVFLFDQHTDITAKAMAPVLTPGYGFFPEGGSLINGLDNAVAFRAVDDKGEPLALSGYLKDDAGKVVETFKTTLPGFGRFSFMPSKNRQYTAVLTLPDKTEKNFPLEPSAPAAWQVSLVRETEKTFTFRVAQGDSLYALKPTSYVAAISHGRLAFAGIGNGLYEVSIPKENLQAGPVDVFLFNDRRQVVSRRQVFVRESGVQLTVTPDKTNPSSREFIHLDLELKDAKGAPMNGIVSISVTDDRYVGSGYSWSRHPLMDLTDPIEILPVRYNAIADSVMVISGRVKNNQGQAAAGYVANIMFAKDNLLLTDTLDAAGQFSYRVPEFYDGKTYTMQVTDAKGAVVPVTLQTSPQVSVWPGASHRWVTDSAARFAEYRKADADSFMAGASMMVIQQAREKQQTGKKAAQADVANRNSRMITGEQLDRLGLGTTAQAVMMLPGIVLVGGKITIRGGTSSIDGGGSDIEPLVITDGVPATKTGVAEYLNAIPPQNIESIEVMMGPEAAQYGTRGINGVILVKTAKQMRDLPFDPRNGFRYITPQGYHQATPFYMPPYQEPEVRYLGFVDNRSTIYWNGDVLTDKNGKARVSFYAADQPAGYTIHIKGISSRGDLIDKTIQFGKK